MHAIDLDADGINSQYPGQRLQYLKKIKQKQTNKPPPPSPKQTKKPNKWNMFSIDSTSGIICPFTSLQCTWLSHGKWKSVLLPVP